MLNRRELLGTAAAGAALAALPARLAAATSTGAVTDPKLAAVLAGIAESMLQNSPETATSLGLDTGAMADLAGKLSDISLASVPRDLARLKGYSAQLAGVNPAGLSDRDRNFYETTKFALDLGLDGAWFDYGFTGPNGGIPYIVSQQNGAYQNVPEFLDSQQRVENAADVQYYLSRMEAFAVQVDQENDRIKADAGRGVVLPIFLLDNALRQMEGMRRTPAGEQRMVTGLAERAKKVGVADPTRTATAIVEERIYPALSRQIDVMKSLKGQANADAGAWKFPNGADYYNWLLRGSTTTRLGAETIHATGLRQTAELQAGMDAVLKSQGLSKGTVGERLSAMTADPKFLFPNNDEGRAAIIAFIQGRIDAVRPRMPELSNLRMNAPVQVKRVPPDIQDGAALGYMNFASLDGKRPAIYYVNLKDTGVWPSYTLASLTAHEAIPGHAWQGAYLAEHKNDLPLISSLVGFNAFTEGWALYAEQLVDEIGMYKTEPFWRVGFLQALNFRAVRLVVDTGLHYKKWSRNQAIDYMVANTGRARAAVQSEVDRYCASPGQACGYKIGHNEIVRLRDKAKAALGPKFSLPAFNDAVVTTGGVPLEVLGGVIDRYIARG